MDNDTERREGQSVSDESLTQNTTMEMDQTSGDYKPTVQVSPEVKTKKTPWLLIILSCVLVAVGLSAWLLLSNDKTKAPVTNKTKSKQQINLVFAVHFLEDYQMNGVKKDGKVVHWGLNQYIDEYNRTHPDVHIVAQQIEYSKYADQLKILNDSGAGPDIYQIYSPWGASYVRDGILDEPSNAVQTDVKQNYVSYAGATINGKIWGYPTELNNYALLYNKDLFKKAGLVDSSGNALVPKTWKDVQDYAKKLTKRDAKGNITQYGIAFTKDNDWQVVDPFLSLLFTNGGSYLSADNKHALFNSAAGVAALDAQLQLFRDGSTDINGNFFDFGTGKVGMVVAPPWPQATFSENFGSAFSSTVGVAPFPYITTPGTLQYSWFMGVLKSSQHKEQAWDFLKWIEGERQQSGTTRYGDLLANTIGSIPARKDDFNSHKDALNNFFMGTYVKQMQTSTAEPNVLQASGIKAALMSEIQSAWLGQKTSKQALDSAAATVDKMLAEQK